MKNRMSSVLATLAIAMSVIFGVSSAAVAGAIIQPTIITPTNSLEGNEFSAVTTDGSAWALSSYYSEIVTLVDTATHTTRQIDDSIRPFSEPSGVAFTPDGQTLYVGNYNDNFISVVDVATATVTSTFDITNSETLGLGISPDGTKLVTVDDYNDVYVYDLTQSPPAVIGYDSISSQVQVFFQGSNDFALLVGDSGDMQWVDLATGLIDSTVTTSTGSAYWCANADETLFATSDGSANFATLAPVRTDSNSGTVISTSDLSSTVSSLTGCAFTNQGQVLLTDYNTAPAIVAVVDASNGSLLDTVTFAVSDDLDYTQNVMIQSNCEALTSGYYNNIGVMQLDSDWCTVAPAPSPNPDPTPELASTGVNASGTNSALAVGGALFAAGIIAMTVALRRKRN